MSENHCIFNVGMHNFACKILNGSENLVKYMALIAAQANSVQVICSEENLRHNYRYLKKYGHLLPAIKADAYGHDALAVAKVLADEGVEGMSVGTVSEGLALRQTGIKGPLIVLMGILGIEEARLAIQHDLLPIVHSLICVNTLEEAACQLECARVPFVLKLDSGMGRVGFTLETLPALLTHLKEGTCLEPVYVLSHHAGADSPALKAYVQKQIDCFMQMFPQIREQFPTIRISFFNSAALHTAQAILQARLREVLGSSQEVWGRPGLALYGLNPFHGTSNEPLYAALRPVMSVTAPVLSVRTVLAGESISYGCTFTAPKDMQVAVVGIGYANGYFRQCSNTAWMLFHGVRVPIVGRVCMQMTMVDCTHVERASQGDRIYVLGGPGDALGDASGNSPSDASGACDSISAYELAAWAQTISYEVVCALGKNVHVTPAPVASC